VLQFGEPVRIVREPGLYVRTPFIQELTRFDKRVLSREVTASEYLTLDRKRMVVDHVARWRIVDPLAFYRTVRTEPAAVARMDDLTASRFRQELARFEFIPIVRERRDDIMETVSVGVAEAMRPFGIEIVDVRIRRLDLPSEVQDSVYARMQAERHRQAERFRAEGEERSRLIRARALREQEVILAEAYGDAQRLRGEGDARSIEIAGRAFGQDPEFYGFMRRIEAYERLLNKGTTLVMSPDSDLFRYLQTPRSQ
jgi:membrane protease subunit HflC